MKTGLDRLCQLHSLMHENSDFFPLGFLQIGKPNDLLLNAGIDLLQLIQSQLQCVRNDLSGHSVVDGGPHAAVHGHAH